MREREWGMNIFLRWIFISQHPVRASVMKDAKYVCWRWSSCVFPPGPPPINNPIQHAKETNWCKGFALLWAMKSGLMAHEDPDTSPLQPPAQFCNLLLIPHNAILQLPNTWITRIFYNRSALMCRHLNNSYWKAHSNTLLIVYHVGTDVPLATSGYTDG